MTVDSEQQVVTWRLMDEAPHDKTVVLVYTSDFGPVMAYWDAGKRDPRTERFGAWVTTWELDGDYLLYCGATPVAWASMPTKPSFARDPLFDDDGG